MSQLDRTFEQLKAVIEAETHHQQEAVRLSGELEEQADKLGFPCPICGYEVRLQGTRGDRLYEFNADEPGTITPLRAVYLVMQCVHCGFTAEFDEDFFDPTFLRSQVRTFTAQARVYDYQVMVALDEDDDPTTLVMAARQMAKVHQGEVIALHIEPHDRPHMEVLQRSATIGDTAIPLEPVVRISQTVGPAIVLAAREYAVERLMLGWRGAARTRGVFLSSTIDQVIERAPCDVIVIRDHGWPSPLRHILVPTAGGPNGEMALEIAGELAQQTGAKITALYVEGPTRSRVDDQRVSQEVQTALKRLPTSIEFEFRTVPGQDVAQTVLRFAADHDLTIVGATRESLLQQLMFGNVPERIARENPSSTFMVKRHAPVRQWLRRVFGTR